MSLARILSRFAPIYLAFLTAQTAMAIDAMQVDTEHFAEVRKVIDKAIEDVGAKKVLVVFDIDNTMMATDLDIGSEHWYQWQEDLISRGIGPEGGAVTRNMDGLLQLQSWIYSITTMRPTDASIPQAMKSYTDRGVLTMALTSRGPEMRDATLREIKRSNIDLGKNAPGPSGGYVGRFTLSDKSLPVIFENGVMLTQGQHKGEMLAGILEKTGAKPSAIVFMDDRPHHLEGIRATFKTRAERIYTVRYDHERSKKAQFAASDKKEAREQWCALSQSLNTLQKVAAQAQAFYPCAKSSETASAR